MSNPYQPPRESPRAASATLLEKPLEKGWLRWCRVLAWAYPLVLIASFYCTWLVAWGMLGHKPRPSLNDPSSIGWQVDIPYLIAGLLLIGFPGAIITGLMLECITEHRPWIIRIVSCVLLAGLWMATICYLRWDPLEVGDWYMD